ncbi:MAG: hypothetical protein Q8K31_05100 [Burkholderiaceae bacterium]|nr:hypothetical protein [Burkholderiaceae bacterium]MDO9088949.1 hypothetical protein [Burkholderiaceae bacterium]MDP1968546.1 hypothetical protein [Burkholderiaceae bacterium]
MSGFKLSDAARPDEGDQPLGLTVHSLPRPGEAVADDGRRKVRGRWKMLLVMLVCAAPVVASYFTYYVVRPEGRRSFGELIEPQRPMPLLQVRQLDGSPVGLQSLRGQWLMVAVAGGACDARCERQLYLQRQLREGLGRDKDRVDRVWLVDDAAPVTASLLPALKGAAVLRVPADELARWLAPADGHRLDEHFYIVDPQGNWMLRFPPLASAADAARAKRDVERLLRASASWDQPGR